MTYYKNLKNRSHPLALLAVLCSMALITSCSHKKKTDDTAADAATDLNNAPAAGTDAAPPADGTPAAAADPSAPPTDPSAVAQADGSTPPAGSDGSSQPPSNHKKGKGKKPTHHSNSQDVAATTPDSAAASTTAGTIDANAPGAPGAQTPPSDPAAMAAATPPQQQQITPPPAQPAAPPQDLANAAANMQQPSNPEQAGGRAPASAHNNPAHPDGAAGEINPESSGGGIMETLAGYRSIIMAIAGLGLLGFGGFTLWKKRQEMA